MILVGPRVYYISREREAGSGAPSGRHSGSPRRGRGPPRKFLQRRRTSYRRPSMSWGRRGVERSAAGDDNDDARTFHRISRHSVWCMETGKWKLMGGLDQTWNLNSWRHQNPLMTQAAGDLIWPRRRARPQCQSDLLPVAYRRSTTRAYALGCAAPAAAELRRSCVAFARLPAWDFEPWAMQYRRLVRRIRPSPTK